MNECIYEKVCNSYKNNESETKEVRWTQKPLVRQAMVSSCVCASFFQLGLFIGACPVLIAQLQREPLRDGSVIDDEKASWISSAGAFSGIPCVLLLGLMVEYLGRRLTYLFMGVATCASFIVFYCVTSFNMLILALILQGPLIGGFTIVCMVLASECVSPKYRGLFMPINTSTMFWGIWVANAVGTFFHWKNICIIGFVFAVYNTLMIIICPDSPFWLASKGKISRCIEAHRWYRGTNVSAEKELEFLIESEMARSQKTKQDETFSKRLISYVKKISASEFYKPMGLCILLTIMFHFSGKYVLTMYAIDIIKKITDSEIAAYTGMLMLDGITVLGMYTGSAVIRYIKRRTLFLWTEFVAIFFLFVLSLYLYLIQLGLMEENVYFSISLLLAFSLSISCGPMIMIGLLLTELLPLKSRILSGILQCIATNVIGGISLKLAPWIFSSCGTHGAFLFFAAGSLVFTIILLKYLPETKNKTLDQIESLFKKDKQLKETKELVQLTEPARAKCNVSSSV